MSQQSRLATFFSNTVKYVTSNDASGQMRGYVPIDLRNLPLEARGVFPDPKEVLTVQEKTPWIVMLDNRTCFGIVRIFMTKAVAFSPKESRFDSYDQMILVTKQTKYKKNVPEGAKFHDRYEVLPSDGPTFLLYGNGTVERCNPEFKGCAKCGFARKMSLKSCPLCQRLADFQAELKKQLEEEEQKKLQELIETGVVTDNRSKQLVSTPASSDDDEKEEVPEVPEIDQDLLFLARVSRGESVVY